MALGSSANARKEYVIRSIRPPGGGVVWSASAPVSAARHAFGGSVTGGFRLFVLSRCKSALRLASSDAT